MIAPLSRSQWNLALACALAVAPIACRSNTPPGPADLPYRARTVERGPDGHVVKALLAEPTTIGGHLCMGWVQWRSDGTLEGADLAADSSVSGHVLPRGSRIFLRADGSLELCWLSRPTTIAGIECAGGAIKIATAFHPDGRLAAAYLARDQVIQGLPCKASVMEPVRFDESGALIRR